MVLLRRHVISSLARSVSEGRPRLRFGLMRRLHAAVIFEEEQQDDYRSFDWMLCRKPVGMWPHVPRLALTKPGTAAAVPLLLRSRPLEADYNSQNGRPFDAS
jgi:hypothetical protein